MRRFILSLLFLCLPSVASAMPRFNGFCQQGNNAVITSGISGTPLVMASFPQCQITVYFAGTTTLAAIFSDQGITPLPNPFTADGFGYFFFYVASGSRVDVLESATGMTTYTIGDTFLSDTSGGGGGGSISVNGVSVPSPNFQNTTNANFVVTGSNITLSLIGFPLLSSPNTFTAANTFNLNPTFAGNPAISVSGIVIPGHCTGFLSATVIQDVGTCSSVNLLSSNNIWLGTNQFNQNVSLTAALNVSGLGTGGGVFGSTAAGGPLFTSSNYKNCSDPVLVGASDSTTIQSCFQSANSINSTAMNVDAGGLSGNWSGDPFDSATIPASGTLIIHPGTTQVSTPIVSPQGWSLECSARTYKQTIGQVGCTLEASPSFPGGYQSSVSGGTATMGTPGTGEVITFSGAGSFSGVVPKCWFLSPATQPTAANSTYGMIQRGSSPTNASITLQFGVNNGTGAPAASSFIIWCDVYSTGDGGTTGNQFGMSVNGIGFDANNIANVEPLRNVFGQQGTHFNDINVRNFCGNGFVNEGNGSQNSSGHDINSSPGTCGGAASLPFVIRNGGAPIAWNFERLTGCKGSSSTSPTICIDVQGNNNNIYHADLENVNGSSISVGANTSCVPACVMPPRLSNGNVFIDTKGSGTGKLIHLSNAFGALVDTVIIGASIISGLTNTLVDDTNSCSPTDSRLAEIIYGHSGKIAFNSQLTPTAGCMPLAEAYTFATLPSAANGVAPIFCSDCNATCTAGSSTGQYCIRVNGSWTH